MSAADAQAMRALICKDLREFTRDRRLSLAAAVVVLLALLSLMLAWQQVDAYERERIAAEALDRRTWLEQGERSPHGAAHFNSWAFRPLSAMSLLDPGVTPYAGAAIWMEAHYQDAAAARAAEDRVGALDLGQFSLAWVLQTLAPLLVAVLAAGLVARERERGTLRLMLVSGLRVERAVALKTRAMAILAALVLAPLLPAAAALVALAPTPVDADQIQRLALWLGAHVMYLGAAVLLAVAVSVRVRSVDRAMVLLVGGWLLAVPLSPRLGATAAEALAPLPAATTFWSQVTTDLGAVDVFDADNAAARRLQEATLQRYGVTRLEDLPVNFAGIQLDAAERQGNAVFDRHYAALHAIEDRQQRILRATALISPLVAVQNVSAGLAGTDSAHQRAFVAQAEAHRRHTVGLLNGDMIRNAGRENFDYKAGPALWAQIPSFAYRAPAWTALWRGWLPDALILLAWVAAGMLALRAAARALASEEP